MCYFKNIKMYPYISISTQSQFAIPNNPPLPSPRRNRGLMVAPKTISAQNNVQLKSTTVICSSPKVDNWTPKVNNWAGKSNYHWGHLGNISLHCLWVSKPEDNLDERWEDFRYRSWTEL